MEQVLTKTKKDLFAAFQEDHTLLREKLHRMREALAQSDFATALQIGEDINLISGAHMAFEEFDFYPALRKFLTQGEVFRMYLEHADGLALIGDVLSTNLDHPPTESEMLQMFGRLQVLEHHVSDCGDLFSALNGLEPVELERLYNRLLEWRVKAPKWQDLAKLRPAADRY